MTRKTKLTLNKATKKPSKQYRNCRGRPTSLIKTSNLSFDMGLGLFHWVFWGGCFLVLMRRARLPDLEDEVLLNKWTKYRRSKTPKLN